MLDVLCLLDLLHLLAPLRQRTCPGGSLAAGARCAHRWLGHATRRALVGQLACASALLCSPCRCRAGVRGLLALGRVGAACRGCEAQPAWA